ncbi:hypothetical protein PHSY_002474 [Pseudozyma hubeiensis SY62]|uniref:Uncharacterized protein n=1 Tax=Pseudozyma hubeiensis (strain SY62) TaxID=1305764 RepID=R9P128_PSEHS|nr:hypothetical protein PHSY_002474 [Pseudozyma hubeiensis SY62]GAC94901.1 hypothetical protein PHSY_002474 [Pseudozyma hubeiensis SY62]
MEEVDEATELLVAVEASVARARVKERALDGELGFVRLLRSTGIDETVQRRSESQANWLEWAGLTSEAVDRHQDVWDFGQIECQVMESSRVESSTVRWYADTLKRQGSPDGDDGERREANGLNKLRGWDEPMQRRRLVGERGVAVDGDEDERGTMQER